MAQTSPSENTSPLDPLGMRRSTGYMPVENYGLIGNMHTAALVATDGGLDFMCWPNFDSPSVFCRMLDKDKGGHFTISPVPLAGTKNGVLTTKQQYLPSSAILQTTFLNDDGVMRNIDFFPRPKYIKSEDGEPQQLKKWLVRRVECVRGEIEFVVRVLPAFNYARDRHVVEFNEHHKEEESGVCTFRSDTLALDFYVTEDLPDDDGQRPQIRFETAPGHGLGRAVKARVRMQEGQSCSFVLCDHDPDTELWALEKAITSPLIDRLQRDTKDYWYNWMSQSCYKGRWQEAVHRSLLTLKLLTYEPTGAIIASPTFSLPEAFGGSRNWDYRFSWVRDSSFTIYIFLRMGFRQEAEAYMEFIRSRLMHSRLPNGALPIMFDIHGDTDLPEIELDHLEGYRQSAPVRIGNGAANHKQLDIYGELTDAVYLYNKYGKPISFDAWLSVREMTDFVCGVWKEKDMSIWEVRGEIQNFVYSKIMLWVAIDRALRLADKRNFSCPNRWTWLATRDQIMEDVMEQGYSKELETFVQSYEHPEAIDSAVLIAPLVFFVAPNDPRFTKTLDRILLPPERGGLTSNGQVYRYNLKTSNDGLSGDEGAFSMCTFWLVEALTRAGAYEPKYLEKAVSLFENTLGFANHVNMFSEETSKSGEQLGNTPQAFSHLALVSAAFNLSRVTGRG
ncbi:hypothetical protein CBER1_09041 [Cercospora berteroae]|uniref:Uncharacterized protein n=1 Tax=Cercospora berteroae TaxID=357750 RepID=A0A2S6CIY7_9PEZI|nr:hypothetical protein CBER1_09041 [Cercospora berteroae]